MTEPLLVAENLTKSFGATVAVDDLSVAIEPGECRGIIGPNGSGKTTLFDLLTGYHDPDAGQVRFDGEVITGEPPDRIARRGLVRTFQLVAPFEDLSVRQNLLSVYPTDGGSGLRVPRETVDRAETMLELLGLDGVADSAAGEVSGGQQKLLELGRVLMLDPSCVLLDEPTAGVNPEIQDRLMAHLRRLNEQGTTLVIIEHDMAVVGELADRISVLDRGRIIAEGPFESVVDDPRVRTAYLGRDADPADGSNAETVSRQREGRPGGVDQTRSHPSSANDVRTAPSGSPGHQSAAGSPRLLTRDVVAGYGNQTVLHGVSIRSHDGVTCVFGPNGSGKSTLLRAIAGVVPIWSGAVEYEERDLTDLEPHQIVDRGITTVPQGGQLFGSLTVRENLLLGATPMADGTAVQDRLEAVQRAFPPLEAAFSADARSLSGGQQAMLAFARAMMTGADVYLLDEPVSGLAPGATDEVFGMIRSLVDQGAHVILVEQKVSKALEIADHVYLLVQGRIRFDGQPAALKREDELMNLYLGVD
ncbi:MAG: ATP-binding cassette domain-containing protein [Halobacteriales archaeon]